MSSINILFFSNHCEGSKQLIAMMNTEKLTRFFHMICVDNNPKIPPQIKVTPTIIIKGVPIPYVAGDAFAWLSKVKQWKINMLMQKASQAQQQYLQNMNSNLGTANSATDGSTLLEFSKEEMAGMSDIFAYLQTDNAAPQSFFNTSQMGQENIFTPPLENGQFKISSDGKYRINANKQKELHTALEMERKKQDVMFKSQIENFRKQYTGK
jgi:hypothetical protein